MAAQMVSGIGFIGGGVISMPRDVVRGLTAAASVWLTALLGMACGAGMPALAIATTIGHFIIMLIFPRLPQLLPRERRVASRIHVAYQDWRGLLRDILVTCSRLRFAVDHVKWVSDQTSKEEAQEEADRGGLALRHLGRGVVALSMPVKSKRPVNHLIAALADIDGVMQASSSDDEHGLE